MKLVIHDPNSVLNDSFKPWFIMKLRNHIINSISDAKLQNWNTYLNELPEYRSIYKKKLAARDIIIAGASNLIAIDSSDSIIFMINPNIYAPGLDRVKLDSICKLINYGNNDMKAYPIFTDTFNYFRSELQTYISRFLAGLI